MECRLISTVVLLVVMGAAYLLSTGCEHEPNSKPEPVWRIPVKCPFVIASDRCEIQTDDGLIVINEQKISLEPNGVPCPGHILEIPDDRPRRSEEARRRRLSAW